MSEYAYHVTDEKVSEELSNRVAGLFDTIRSAERSRCLVVWIGDHSNEVNKIGYQDLFGHLQEVIYADFILSTVAVYEPESSRHQINSFPGLLAFLKKNKDMIEVGRSTAMAEKFSGCECVLSAFVNDVESRLPAWPKEGVKPKVDSLDEALDRMKYKRDKLIGHTEYFHDAFVPRPSLEMLGDGCGLLPLAMETFDLVAPLTSWVHRFHLTAGSNREELAGIRHISKQFGNVVAGRFAKNKAFWDRPTDEITKDYRNGKEPPSGV